jgi:hypothetical protein
VLATLPKLEVATYEFSLSISASQACGSNKMRWRIGADEWLCDRIRGRCQSAGVDCRTGKMFVRGILTFKEENGETIAQIYRDPEAPMQQRVEGMQKPWAFTRLCYNREEKTMRFRNELTGELEHVLDYQGDFDLSWRDSGTHVFTTGTATLVNQIRPGLYETAYFYEA